MYLLLPECEEMRMQNRSLYGKVWVTWSILCSAALPSKTHHINIVPVRQTDATRAFHAIS